MSIYLDHNATTQVRPDAIAAVTAVMARVGNASSVHAGGRAAHGVLEQARADVAALLSVDAPSIVFTSGGTEANALAIESAVATGSRRLIVSTIEHNSVSESAKASGAVVEFLPVTAEGRADLAWLDARLAAWDAADGRPFVTLMLANNETGVIQPVVEAAERVRAAGGWFHVDTIQGAGKIPVNMAALGADTLSISAHKIGGPQGVGALAVGPRATIVRRQHGGGHERGLRSGTENLPGIAGLAAAARAGICAAPAAWRDAAAERLRSAGAVVMGESAPRLANTLCVATLDFPAQTQLMALDLAGVMVSAGSACSSGKAKPSHVLAAMGHDALATCAIRVSGGWNTTAADWTAFADAWLQAHDRHFARRRDVA